MGKREGRSIRQMDPAPGSELLRGTQVVVGLNAASSLGTASTKTLGTWVRGAPSRG